MPVSVVILTYNRAYCLGEAIESVLNQTYKDLELIICDDASTDNTGEIVSRYHDDRIVYYRNEKNMGSSLNRNVGISLARYDLIMFWEDDITYDPNSVEVMVQTYNELTEKGLKVGGITPRSVDEPKTGKLLKMEKLIGDDMRKKIGNKPSHISRWNGLIYKNFLFDSGEVLESEIANPWSMFNKRAIEEFGGFSPWFSRICNYSHEETDFYLMMNKKGYHFYYQPKAVSHHKYTGSGGTRVSQLRYGWYYLMGHLIFLVKDYGWRASYMIPALFISLPIFALRYIPKL